MHVLVSKVGVKCSQWLRDGDPVSGNYSSNGNYEYFYVGIFLKKSLVINYCFQLLLNR